MRFLAVSSSDDLTIALVEKLQRLAPSNAAQLIECLCEGLSPDTPESQQYHVAETLAMAIYPKYKFSEYARIYLEDGPFKAYYERFMDAGNWHSMDRKYVLNQLLKLVTRHGGDAVECGTYKGASAYLMCTALQKTGRLVHLFDSFEGLSPPDHRDGSYWTPGALQVPETAVHQTLAEFQNHRIYRGWIPGRFAEITSRPICFLHIDVDLYQPTRDSLEFFYPQIEPEGVILMDDYGFTTCPGAKRAADEFFSDKREPIVMLPTGQAFVIKEGKRL